jgi:hypothetical protein
MTTTSRALATAAALLGFSTAAAAAHADPKQDCADAYEATQSLRDRDHLLDARKQALACTASACSVYITRDCAQWLAEIDAILPTVVFTGQDPAGAEIRSVRVTVDGQAAAEQLDGKAIALDPGDHVVRFETAGSDPIEQKVTLRKGEKDRKLSASFKKALPAKPIAPPPAVSPATPLLLPTPDATPRPAPSSGGVPIWAWVSGGAGVVALGISVGLDVHAANLHSEVVKMCGGDAAVCPPTTITMTVTAPLAHDRDQFRNIGIGLGVAGVVGLGAAILGIVTAPSKPSAPRTSLSLAPCGSPSSGGLMLQGQF